MNHAAFSRSGFNLPLFGEESHRLILPAGRTACLRDLQDIPFGTPLIKLHGPDWSILFESDFGAPDIFDFRLLYPHNCDRSCQWVWECTSYRPQKNRCCPTERMRPSEAREQVREALIIG